MLESPDPAPPDLFGTKRAARRLRALTLARLETGEEVVAWTRAWVSRDRRLNTVFAARTPVFAVLTHQRLMCWSVGFFTRRPRHRVLTDRLDDLKVTTAGKNAHPLSRLRVQALARKPVRFDFRRRDRPQQFAAALCDAVAPAPVTTALPETVDAAPDPSPPEAKESR